MSTQQPTYRKPLNTSQIKLLQTLYKFRFATTELIATSYTSKYRRVIYARLKVLLDQNYIGQRYDGQARINRQPAKYYLASKGLAYLKTQPFAQPKVIKRIYNDKHASEMFVEHCLQVFATYIKFKQLYPGEFQFFSNSELAQYDHFSEKQPDAYLQRRDSTSSYWLDYYEASRLLSIHRQRLRKYIEFFESEVWQEVRGELPTILMVCETPRLQRQLLKAAQKILDTTWVDCNFLAITNDALRLAASDTDIWKDNNDELIALRT